MVAVLVIVSEFPRRVLDRMLVTEMRDNVINTSTSKQIAFRGQISLGITGQSKIKKSSFLDGIPEPLLY